MPVMRDVKLPGPEGRVVVFGGTVFKLKYKLSSINIKEVKHKFDGRISLIQKDIRVFSVSKVLHGPAVMEEGATGFLFSSLNKLWNFHRADWSIWEVFTEWGSLLNGAVCFLEPAAPSELTAAILDRLCTDGVLTPLRTDLMVIFPEFLPWEKVNQLEFGYSNCMLTPYPNMVFMLVRVLPSDPSAAKDKALGILGKHKLLLPTPLSTAPQEHCAQDSTDVNCQKKMKVCSSFPVKHSSPNKGEDPSAEAALPVEPATTSPLEPDPVTMPTGAGSHGDGQTEQEEVAMEVDQIETRARERKVDHMREFFEHPPTLSLYDRLRNLVRYMFGW